MKLIKDRDAEKERIIPNIEFDIHKLSRRNKPKDKRKITIISCLSEFGCETIGATFCIPKILTVFPNEYVVVVGWYGREFLYRHLVDEFWELKEDYQWLREYCRAFHHESINLKRFEKKLSDFGTFISAEHLGRVAVGNRCLNCHNFWGDIKNVVKCPQCSSVDIDRSLFADMERARKSMVPLPPASSLKAMEAEKYLKPNSVAIFARGRKTYGRNLQPEFYVKLINNLEQMGYNPVWLGEKQSTQPCPVEHIIDFSRMPESKDLELTLAILKQCKFSVQFWTASTRLSALAGIPFLLFESPDQIWGVGQEGYRLNLLKELAPKKMVISHFNMVLNDHDTALELVNRAIKEMEVKNYSDIIGMVEEPEFVHNLRLSNNNRIDND